MATTNMFANENTTLIPKGVGEEQENELATGRHTRGFGSGLALILGVLAILGLAAATSLTGNTLLADLSADAAETHEYKVIQPFTQIWPSYMIASQFGLEVYQVKMVEDRVHKDTAKFSFRDVQGKEIALVKEGRYTYLDYEIERNGTMWAEFTADASKYNDDTGSWLEWWYKTKLYMNVVGEENDYKIVQDNYWSTSPQYRVERTATGVLAATISHIQSYQNEDEYKVVIQDGQDDEVAILLISIVLDRIYTIDNA